MVSHSNIVGIHGKDSSSAKLHLFGATIVSWIVDGKERLFLSSKAALDGSKAIRGGIPLVFPQFGPSTHRKYPLPQHGFARLMMWRVIGRDDHESSITLESKSHDHPALEKDYPHPFTLQYKVTLKEGELEMVATVFNTGPTEISFDWLYHTYLRVEDVSRASVGDMFHDYDCEDEFCEQFKLKNDVLVKYEEESSVKLSVKNLTDLVIWNPGAEKAGLMSDLGRGEERSFICVEAGSINPADGVSLLPGHSISFAQILSTAK
jgi:glucose-6-phosphate 1-epimerase